MVTKDAQVPGVQRAGVQRTVTRRHVLRSLAAGAGLALAGKSALGQGLSLSATDIPYGYYVLQNTDSLARISLNSLANPNVAGIVLRRRWSALNPSFGWYNWSFLDAQIARAKLFGKMVQLVVFAGVSAPNWLYASGAQRVIFQDSRYPGQTFSMPAPWDPIMLARWGTFVSALGARYDSDPAVTLIYAGGPTRFSCEMYVPDEAMQLSGFSNAAIIDAWAQVTNAYNSAFLNTAISFNLSHATSASDGVPQAVSANAITVLGDRATLQQDSLSGHTSSGYDVQSLLVSYAQSGVRTGYEMVSASSGGNFNGAFADAVNTGRQAGGQFINLYQPDIPQLLAPY